MDKYNNKMRILLQKNCLKQYDNNIIKTKKVGELENTIRKENWGKRKKKSYIKNVIENIVVEKNIIDITMQRTTKFLSIASQKITSRQTMSKRY